MAHPKFAWAGTISQSGQTAHPTKAKTTPIKKQELVKGWEKHVHPNGSLYYHHKDKRVTTNLRNDQSPTIEDATFHPLPPTATFDPLPPTVCVAAKLDLDSLPAGRDWEAYVNQDGGEPQLQWIDHKEQRASAFDKNLEDEDADRLCKSRYWSFIHNHPTHTHHKIVYSDYSDFALDALTWCYADRLLFGRGNATFSRGDSKELIDILKILNERQGKSNELKIWFIACILEAIHTDRYYTRYGLPDASSSRRRERQETTPWLTPSWQIKTLYHIFESTLCFGVTHSYFKRIHAVDRTRFNDGVSTDRWQSFVSSLLSEWRDSNLVATVLLAANISFLALTDIDSITRILCLVSIMCSLGSVAFGSYLAWKHQSQLKSTADIGLRYFMRARIISFVTSSLPLAFILSLPIVLLLWALLSFIAAVCEYALRKVSSDSNITSHINIVVIVILSIFGASAILMWKFFHNVWADHSRPTHLETLSRFYSIARFHPRPDDSHPAPEQPVADRIFRKLPRKIPAQQLHDKDVEADGDIQAAGSSTPTFPLLSISHNTNPPDAIAPDVAMLVSSPVESGIAQTDVPTSPQNEPASGQGLGVIAPSATLDVWF